ncbi:MAG: 23S rRNA (adenine(2503)-C(2))-methyltransferase RlmN [Rikenellaceae bacterium]
MTTERTLEQKALFGLTLNELEAVCAEQKLPKFVAKQIADWLYGKRVTEIEQMSNLSKVARATLAQSYTVGRTPHSKVSEAKDGTKKYLFMTAQGAAIESVFIPDGERGTLCVSSQAGCRMGCTFCATARQGLQHSLSSGEIVNQIASLPEFDRLTNIVFMGMGEPLDNVDNLLAALEIITAKWGWAWSPHRITVSTAGVTSQIRRLLEESGVDIAVSLHNPYADERAEIMPIEKAFPIKEFIAVLREYDFSGQRRVSFEYILMSGKNGSPHHVRELGRLLNGLKCRINIIKFHKIPDSPYFSPEEEKILRFRDALTAKGIHTTVRRSRGEDIEAACGLLSTNNSIKR